MTPQMWLILMLYGAGGVLVMLGYCLMLHQSHNILGDPMWPPLFAVAYASYSLCCRCCRRASRYILRDAGGARVASDKMKKGPGTYKV